MIPALVVMAYLGVVLYIGIFASRARHRAMRRSIFLPGARLGRRCSCCRSSAPT
jgi:hypothetical protein